MDPYWNGTADFATPTPYYHELHQMRAQPSQENLYRRLKKLERKVDDLARLMEENNRLLKTLAKSSGNTVVPGGGGSTVVVRM